MSKSDAQQLYRITIIIPISNALFPFLTKWKLLSTCTARTLNYSEIKLYSIWHLPQNLIKLYSGAVNNYPDPFWDTLPIVLRCSVAVRTVRIYPAAFVSQMKCCPYFPSDCDKILDLNPGIKCFVRVDLCGPRATLTDCEGSSAPVCAPGGLKATICIVVT